MQVAITDDSGRRAHGPCRHDRGPCHRVRGPCHRVRGPDHRCASTIAGYYEAAQKLRTETARTPTRDRIDRIDRTA